MMKTTIKYLYTGVAAVMMLSGCIKEAFPTDRVLEDQVSVETLIKGIPAALVMPGSTGYASPWDFSMPAVHLAMESMTGDLIVTGSTNYDWFQQWGMNDALGPEYAVGAIFWLNYYNWIKSANDVIRMLGASDMGELSATDKTYLGLAYAYRAMFYFDLTRMYEFRKNKYTEADDVLGLAVPLVLPSTTESDAKDNPRITVDDMYGNLIFPDLERALSLLKTQGQADKYTIRVPVRYGMLARAWLERGTAYADAGDDSKSREAYGKAADYARQAIVSSGCTPLTQEEWEDPSNGFNNAVSNNSWMWGLAMPSESVVNLLCFTAHMSTENDWSAYGNDTGRGINRNLYNSIDRNDFRKHSWLDPDRSFYDYKSCRDDGDKYFSEKLKDYTNIKFRPAQGAYKDYTVGGAADHVMMRVEEMYFIEAEAKGHLNPGEGVTLLNDFMNSYRMTNGARYDCSSKVNGKEDAFIRELMLQKRIEFWGEGIVMFDMKRLDQSTKRGYPGTNAPPSYRLNTDGRAPYWNFCIPRSEEQNNTAVMKQRNPDPSGKVPVWNG